MGRKIFRTFIGILAGYVAYIPALFVVEYATYGRIDSEKAFYALFYAFGAPFLLTPSGWKYARIDEILLNLIGAILLIFGAIVANWRAARSTLTARSR
jgi:glycopeptide antibiotics resistance protein